MVYNSICYPKNEVGQYVQTGNFLVNIEEKTVVDFHVPEPITRKIICKEKIQNMHRKGTSQD